MARHLWAVAAAMMMVTWSGCGAPAPVSKRHPLAHEYAVADAQFVRAVTHLTAAPLTGGNRVDTLVNGDEIFPAMLEAIRNAKHSITLETYIYWSGEIGEELSLALAERAQAGVKVHLIFDAVGSDRMDQGDLRRMRDAGVAVVPYHPPTRVLWLIKAWTVNHRTHRKLLVVDGKVGFIGGAGIADHWRGQAQDAEHWRDTHYRVEGPVVASLQAAFAQNWSKATGQVLDGEAYFPALEAAGDVRASVLASSPESGSAAMELMKLLSINAAAESIYVGTPYFVPTDKLMAGLLAARERGVAVTLVMPGRLIDEPIVRAASRAQWKRLLDAGVEMYEFDPTMFHWKVMVVDGLWTSVGSSNLDPRSFRLNDEANLNVYDRGFARRQVELLEDDIARSRRVTVDQFEKRPLLYRIGEFFASLLSSQL